MRTYRLPRLATAHVLAPRHPPCCTTSGRARLSFPVGAGSSGRYRRWCACPVASARSAGHLIGWASIADGRRHATNDAPERSIFLPQLDQEIEMASGTADKVTGAVKEAAGKLTGDKRTEAEGQTDQVKGKAKNATDNVTEKAKGVRDSLNKE
jgi:uncharacterized protein YjbJ (UPF0337 family)